MIVVEEDSRKKLLERGDCGKGAVGFLAGGLSVHECAYNRSVHGRVQVSRREGVD